MSNNYDSWERLVEAVLDREKLRRIALLDESRESSFNSVSFSGFNFGSTSNTVVDDWNLDIVQSFDHHQEDIMISTSVTPPGNESEADLHQFLEREQMKKFQEVTAQLEALIEPPKRPGSQPSKTTSAFSPAERTKIEALLHKLTARNTEDQISAAGEIRLLTKQNADNCVAIAEAGAIPLLVPLLSTPDSRAQEQAVTALLNLSMCEDNKGSIVSSGAVPGIVHVLKKSSMEARENATATLFSLSVIDQNKVTIGASGAIPAPVTLLSEGTQNGKKDAATTLFNLCIYQGNKGKTIRVGVVPTLMLLLTEPQGDIVDEALAILAILVSHLEGKATIGVAEAVPVLLDVIRN
ncbi:U-box domain-containing protein 13-like [Olea europaea var. sylvestris]|uniref:U-box domain-containing protein 13-like n=1 Tax=Olea europaea var. sylvestris TaxID=158386 RepID=UPI000C1D53BE|nr:U-box domain-containing protein 13-like [Olea europaea var. sylvestris]XP_022847014.1 U-box domain-containing protein 13-like [Olea europaea var. sylvestris]